MAFVAGLFIGLIAGFIVTVLAVGGGRNGK